MFLDAVSIAIEQAHQNTKRQTALKELKLIEMLDIKGKNYEQHSKFLTLFAEENIFDTLSILEGFKGLIEGELRQEATKRPLKELNLKFL